MRSLSSPAAVNIYPPLGGGQASTKRSLTFFREDRLPWVTHHYIGQDADFMEYLRKARSDVKTRCKSEDLPLSSLHLLDEA